VTNDSGDLFIAWDAVDGASEYEVFRASDLANPTADLGVYESLGTTYDNEFLDATVSQGVECHYFVKATIGAVTSDPSDVVSGMYVSPIGGTWDWAPSGGGDPAYAYINATYSADCQARHWQTGGFDVDTGWYSVTSGSNDWSYLAPLQDGFITCYSQARKTSPSGTTYLSVQNTANFTISGA
jgi:hypothetical protein